jgi:signal transduction histidine kinase
METMLYRIAQEAITNVFKHSHATRVGVLVECRRGRVMLSVKDNGCGFELSQTLKRGPNGHARLGITGMQERAALAGGSVEIESAPRAGTTVFVRIPGPQPARSNARIAYEKNPRPSRR